MDNIIAYIFLMGFLGSIVCVLLMIYKGLKNKKIFTSFLSISLVIFLSFMSFSIGIKLASVKVEKEGKQGYKEYEIGVESFNNGNLHKCEEELDKILYTSNDEELIYRASVIKLSLLMCKEKSILYVAELFEGAAKNGEMLYSFENFNKFKERYNKVYKESIKKEQQISDCTQIILSNMDKEKINYKFNLNYNYKSEYIKDLGYFKISAYPIPEESEIGECIMQADNYNLSKFTKEYVRENKIYYSKFLYTICTFLDKKKHGDIYTKCLEKIIEISDNEEEYREKAKEELKKQNLLKKI